MRLLRCFVWLFSLILTLVIQSSFTIYNTSLNLTVLFAYYAGVKGKEIIGLFIGAMVGFLEDNLSGSLAGINMLSKGLIGYMSAFVYNKYFIWTPLFGVVIVVLFTLIDGLLIYTLNSLFNKTPADLSVAFVVIIVQGILNAIFGYFIKPVDMKIYK